jgi:hypothetical protein
LHLAIAAADLVRVSTIERSGDVVELRRGLAKVAALVAAGALVAATSAAVYAWTQASAFDASTQKAYAIPAPTFASSQDRAVLERGRQLTESVGGCTSASCHGADLGGGQTIRMGPLATITGPNITGPLVGSYSNGELARLLEQGIKRDGRGVLFMPVQNFSWLPESDVDAIVSYLRTVPAVARADGPLKVSILGKVLDRRDRVVLDVARRLAAMPRDVPPPPAPTADYGRFLSRACTMCHGEHLSGGPIPGAPASTPVPLNLTADSTGLEDWSFEDFDRVLTTGVRRNGRKLDPFMPYDAFAKYDETQKRALWAYLRSLPPTPFGGR